MNEDDLKTFITDVIRDMAKNGEIEPLMPQDDIEGDNLDMNIEDDGTEEVYDDTEELMEARNTIKTLMSELNEINLLNAKLLYTNKIFKAHNLKESQKLKVLSSLDKAVNIKEAKLVFEILNESFKKTTLNKKPVMENIMGSASKPAGSRKLIKESIVRVDPMVAYFQKIAGLSKK
jgi:hypothetical protein